MGFDLNRFRAAVLSPREDKVDVPELAVFFGDAPPVWTVRGLNGEELSRANDVKSRTDMYAAVVEALASAAKSDQTEALKALMGVTDVPLTLARQFDYLAFGCVDPALSRDDAVKLSFQFPIVADRLAGKIAELTRMGPDLGKA